MRLIKSRAPIRICDNGGWTDTWFAGHGQVLNIAVTPYAEVDLRVWPRRSGDEHIVVNAEDFGQRFPVDPSASAWGPHPLIEAALRRVPVPTALAAEITIHSDAPPGASTGTSAAVAVALLGALDCLEGGTRTSQEIAYLAHSLEVDMLGRQSGIQDQLAAAHGGISFIEMTAFPEATVEPLALPDGLWWELEERLVLVYLGNSHDSSQVHQQVIAGLEHAGGAVEALEDLRRAAREARTALLQGDLPAFGRALCANTAAQARLHPALVGSDAQRVIGIARQHGALGWKVNGAGGEGGSLALLSGPEGSERRRMLRAIRAASPAYAWIPTRISRTGLHLWQSEYTP